MHICLGIGGASTALNYCTPVRHVVDQQNAVRGRAHAQRTLTPFVRACPANTLYWKKAHSRGGSVCSAPRVKRFSGFFVPGRFNSENEFFFSIHFAPFLAASPSWSRTASDEREMRGWACGCLRWPLPLFCAIIQKEMKPSKFLQKAQRFETFLASSLGYDYGQVAVGPTARSLN